MENNIKLTLELSELDKALFCKLLEAVTALNASLLANQGMIAIADTDTPVEGTSRPCRQTRERYRSQRRSGCSDARRRTAQGRGTVRTRTRKKSRSAGDRQGIRPKGHRHPGGQAGRGHG